jgi:fructose-1-phosphate kinase PfkB-like protein
MLDEPVGAGDGVVAAFAAKAVPAKPTAAIPTALAIKIALRLRDDFDDCVVADSSVAAGGVT